MEIEIIRKNLEAQGLSKLIIDSMLKSLKKPATEKKKTAGRWFPGMNESKKKVAKEVTITVICECCGAKETTVKVIEATADSPDTMKLPISICNKCPDFFRALSHEELVSLMLVRRHPGLQHQHLNDRAQVRFAQSHTPEEVVNFRTKHF